MEQGAHEDLLLNEHGTYTRLVQAQKLREAHEQPLEARVGGSSDLVEDVAIAEGVNSRPVSLHIADSRSFHSSSNPVTKKRKDHPLLYIFRRLLGINRGQWLKYVIGSVAAISEWYLISNNVVGEQFLQ